jgi:hypothetical protein
MTTFRELSKALSKKNSEFLNKFLDPKLSHYEALVALHELEDSAIKVDQAIHDPSIPF